MKNLIFRLENSNNNSFYLSLFRVVICSVLIVHIFQIFPFISLVYKIDKPITLYGFINFKPQSEHIYTLVYIYLFSVILYLFGIGKNFTAFIVFIMCDVLQKLNPYLLNGGDNLLKFLFLYMAFADSFTYFSVNKSNKKKRYFSNILSNLSVLSICIHLCLVYFLSALHKINATVWFHGVATYYTFQLERFSGTNLNNILVKNSFFVVISTYFTLILELYYPALVWFNKTRSVVVICMIALHTGIAIFMMLHEFQLIFILVQGFFYKNSFWLPKFITVKNKLRAYQLLSFLK